MKVISGAEGFRLVIPPQALQSLKNIESPDQSVTVMLTRDGDGESLLTVDPSGLGKSSTRPKHYKCSKCGQPKKGHVCEFASDKPTRPKGLSMDEQMYMSHPSMSQLSAMSHHGPRLSLPSEDLLRYQSSGYSGFMNYVPAPLMSMLPPSHPMAAVAYEFPSPIAPPSQSLQDYDIPDYASNDFGQMEAFIAQHTQAMTYSGGNSTAQPPELRVQPPELRVQSPELVDESNIFAVPSLDTPQFTEFAPDPMDATDSTFSMFLSDDMQADPPGY